MDRDIKSNLSEAVLAGRDPGFPVKDIVYYAEEAKTAKWALWYIDGLLRGSSGVMPTDEFHESICNDLLQDIYDRIKELKGEE